MPILFSAVASGKQILADYASCEGNFMEIAEEVLQKIPSRNDKMTYSHGHYLLHYIINNQYCFFCVTSKTCQRSRAFLFLNEIQRRFSPKEGGGFCKVLADEMYRYSEDYSTITIRKGELEEINSIKVGCSESILGEKILFVNNPEDLNYTVITQISQCTQTPVIESIDATESNENSDFFIYIIVTVIFVLMWLILSMLGPSSVLMVACICVLVIAKLPNFSKRKVKVNEICLNY